MKIHVVVAQRKGMYPGEYAPEALDVISENDAVDNPEYLTERLATLASDTGPGKDKEFDSYAVLNIVIPESAIDDALAVFHDVPSEVI